MVAEEGPFLLHFIRPELTIKDFRHAQNADCACITVMVQLLTWVTDTSVSQ